MYPAVFCCGVATKRLQGVHGGIELRHAPWASACSLWILWLQSAVVAAKEIQVAKGTVSEMAENPYW
jgi:hypothetical protein